jgi:hypothetical protein
MRGGWRTRETRWRGGLEIRYVHNPLVCSGAFSSSAFCPHFILMSHMVMASYAHDPFPVFYGLAILLAGSVRDEQAQSLDARDVLTGLFALSP